MAASNVPFTTPGNMYGRTAEFPGANSLEHTTGGSAGDNKLWLPIWSGEVMRAFDQYRMFEPMVESRSISSGRVMEFPITGSVAMKAAWGAGEELIGGIDDSKSKTFAVSLDARPIASHFELDNVDLMVSQWEFRSELARQAGQTLANARDSQVGAYIARAGAETILANDPRLAGGGTVSKWRNSLAEAPIFDAAYDATLANLGTGNDAQRSAAALALLRALEDFMIHLQEINAPGEGVYCAVSPRTFQDIRALGVAREAADLVGGAGRPYFGGVAEAGGLGSNLAMGMNSLSDTLTYMGVTIMKSTHIMGKDHSGGSGDAAAQLIANTANNIGEARYNGNFTDVGALIWQKGCVASLNKTGLKVDTVDDIRRNSVFTVASVMGGTGVLRPECASVVTRATISGSGATAKRGNLMTTAFDLVSEYANTSA
tara:strand:- start:1097 stop:2386 length:1290 start_codon:yes stop_codon:yes gene_type:complete